MAVIECAAGRYYVYRSTFSSEPWKPSLSDPDQTTVAEAVRLCDIFSALSHT